MVSTPLWLRDWKTKIIYKRCAMLTRLGFLLIFFFVALESTSAEPRSATLIRYLRSLKKSAPIKYDIVRARLKSATRQEGQRTFIPEPMFRYLYLKAGTLSSRNMPGRAPGDPLRLVFGNLMNNFVIARGFTRAESDMLGHWAYMETPGIAGITTDMPVYKMHITGATFNDTIRLSRHAGNEWTRAYLANPNIAGDWQVKTFPSKSWLSAFGRPDAVTLYHTNEEFMSSIVTSVNRYANSRGIKGRNYFFSRAAMATADTPAIISPMGGHHSRSEELFDVSLMESLEMNMVHMIQGTDGVLRYLMSPRASGL